jgi:tetratricopeptide (TPR) repeat protein
MKSLGLLVLLLGVPLWSWLTKVRDRNEAVGTGRAAYAQGRPAQAAQAFAAALDARARRTPDPRLILNLGHAQLRAGQLEAARATYGRTLTASPAAVGSVARQQLAVLAARQGQVARALGLLRQALILNPRNHGARYDYEVLSDYLARHQDEPEMPPPSAGAADSPNKPAPKKSPTEKQAAEKAGTDRSGEISRPNQTTNSAQAPPESRPDANGRPDPGQPTSSPGSAASGGRGAGPGTPQPVASGSRPGQQRGPDRSSANGPAAPGGRSSRAGTEAATNDDASLQTQRERLRSMSLSPAQARQLLEALRAQEQQYLQQLTRRPAASPDRSKPTW